MAGLSLGIGGRVGAYSATAPGGTIGSDSVFASPISPDLATRPKDLADHPSMWVLGGCAAWIVLVYLHFHVY
jgi:hypothetical protein